jgi:Zn-dependent M28 family amino/carboxypeptidase
MAYLVGTAPATLLLFLAALFVQADLTPHTAGANDNATGAGLLLALGDVLQGQRLAQTEVWLVVTGCEEVGCVGARSFFDAHNAELRDASLIIVDGVGAAGPCYLRSEGLVWRRSYDAGLLAIADAVALEHADIGAYNQRLGSGYTEGLPALHRGLRAITLCGLTREGELPHWHQATDTVENIDREALARNFAFMRELIERIDRGAAGGTKS